MRDGSSGIEALMLARLLALIVTLVALTAAPMARADAPAKASASAKSPEIPLPELPELASIELPKSSSSATKSLEARLEELVNMPVSDPMAELEERLIAADLEDDLVPAIAERLDRLRQDLDGDRAIKIQEKARKVGRSAINRYRKEHKLRKKDEGPEGDWLVFVLSLGNSNDDTWRGLVELYGMLRMLETMGTTPAVRVMVDSYGYFGNLVRVDLQRAVTRLGDKAVPALLEAKKHDARKVAKWARIRLEKLGRAIPGEAVSTTDPQVLADVLRAFGRVREVDATRVILSFANSERVQLREAAREAITAIGKPAWGHYKDIYKTLTGERPPRDWDHERTVREIFRLYDSSRMAVVYRLFEQGKEALAAEKWLEAAKLFDQVLSRAPLFEHRAVMAPAYLGRADALVAEAKWEDAAVALRKGQRLKPDGDTDKRIASRLATLEARSLLDAGTPDRSLLERAVELDPDNTEAQKLLASFEQEVERRQKKTKSYGVVIALGAGALLMLLLLWLPRLRRRKDATA
jgi:tetratricopeptide (TPR) repeat protein